MTKPADKKLEFGLKMGFLFLFLSLILGATMIVPIITAGLIEGVSSSIAILIEGNTGVVAFWLSLVGVVVPSLFYIRAVLKKSESLDSNLVILFLFLIVFLNSALFYKDWLSPNFRMDGQQGFGIIVMYFKTSLVYLVLGYVHIVLKERQRSSES